MTRNLILAVVEPTPDGEAPLDVVGGHLALGGDATILVLVTKNVRKDIRAFAESEDLELSQAHGIASRRLHDKYAQLLGADIETVMVGDGVARPRRLAEAAASVGAGTIAVPQGLFRGSGLRRLSDLSRTTVVVSPARAA